MRAVEAVTAAAEPRSIAASICSTRTPCPPWSTRVRQRHSRIDVLLHAGGLLTAARCPKRSRRSSTWSLTSRPTAPAPVESRCRRHAYRRHGCVQLRSRSLRQQRPSRTGAANGLLCDHEQYGCLAAQGIRRRHRLDGMGRHRHGLAVPSRRSWRRWAWTLAPKRRATPFAAGDLRRDPRRGPRRRAAGPLGRELRAAGRLGAEKAAQFVQKLDPPWLMAGKPVSANLFGSLEIETTLDPNGQPFLYDHARPARAPNAGRAGDRGPRPGTAAGPGYSVSPWRNEEMLAAFKFHRMEPTLVVRAVITPQAGGDLVAQAVLRSVTEPAKPGLPTREAEHFRAAVRLRREAPEPRRIDFRAPGADSLPIPAAEIYKAFFHGPAYQVIERAAVNGRSAAALMARDLPPNTSPAHAASFMAPRLVELCFQTVALWSLKSTGSMALPRASTSPSIARRRRPGSAVSTRLSSAGAGWRV